MSDNDILADLEIVVPFLTLKHIRDNDFSKTIISLSTYLERIDKKYGEGFINIIIQYWLRATNLPNVKEVIQHIQKKSDNIGGLMASAAEQLLSEGMQQGMLRGKREIAANMLGAKIDLRLIEQTTGLSRQQIKNLSTKKDIID